MSNTKAALWSLFWLLGACSFAGFAAYSYGIGTALTFLSCYFVEQFLSFDNLFMFYVVFKYFDLPAKEQRLVLNVGLISSYILRTAIILPGAWLVNKYSWLNYGFGLFLLVSAIGMLKIEGENTNDRFIQRMVRRFPNMGKMFLVLLTIELTDILFAFDSIPAGFGITNNGLLLLAANVFAIVGLRNMYFLLLNLIERFKYLETALAFILMLVSFKLLVSSQYVMPESVLFTGILGIFGIGLVASCLDSKVEVV